MKNNLSLELMTEEWKGDVTESRGTDVVTEAGRVGLILGWLGGEERITGCDMDWLEVAED